MFDAENIEGENISADNEICSSCGQELGSGDGRFRKPDEVVCLKCYKKINNNGNKEVTS